MIPRTRSSLLRAALLAAAIAVSSCSRASAPAEPKPELFLLTALPLIWSEQFGLDHPQSPAIERLEKVYRITPVDLPSQLPARGLLLAAQPRALPAEELVALDAWVRHGGRLLLLADPMLEWRMERPLGDPLRAPMAYPDTGLLQHWGLRLDAPDERGSRQSQLAGRKILTTSPGALVKIETGCDVEPGALAARCGVGRGEAVIIADADFMNQPTGANLNALESELRAMSR